MDFCSYVQLICYIYICVYVYVRHISHLKTYRFLWIDVFVNKNKFNVLLWDLSPE